MNNSIFGKCMENVKIMEMKLTTKEKMAFKSLSQTRSRALDISTAYTWWSSTRRRSYINIKYFRTGVLDLSKLTMMKFH